MGLMEQSFLLHYPRDMWGILKKSLSALVARLLALWIPAGSRQAGPWVQTRRDDNGAGMTVRVREHYLGSHPRETCPPRKRGSRGPRPFVSRADAYGARRT
jgi:hypothetical protein